MAEIKNPATPSANAPQTETVAETQLPAYEPPRVLKKRSMVRVTLFSGGGASGGGITASG